MAAAELRIEATGAFPVLSETQLAIMRALEGDAVVSRAGCHWRNAHPGFYQPTHLLARVGAADVRQPTALCWGFRAALRAEDQHAANASVPVHVLAGLGAFDERRLSRNRRGDLRRARRCVELRRLTSPALLLDEGYGVFLSAAERLGCWRRLTLPEYRSRVLRRARHGGRMFVAGLVDGKLRGYLDAFAVGNVLYTDELYVATDAMRTGIGTGLYVETLLAGREAGLQTVCNGLHRPEAPQLSHFKAGLGFDVVQVPARLAMPAPIRAFLRARRPAAYYRLTGDASGLVTAPAIPGHACDSEAL